MNDLISRKAVDLAAWITNASGSKTQITKTVYDLPHAPFDGLVWYAKNLRNRVSWSAVYNTAADLNSGNRASGSFYSYDIHGNVKTLVQDYNPGTASNAANRFKKIEYVYDLISGKVNMVSYQPGQADAFYHRYQYDAENRITNVETSRDSVYWENDAYYQYYKHGPLARMVLGQQQVQGVDYAYNLQGWLKGVNSTAVSSGFDMGGDGAAGGITARDAFGFALHYFGNGDYKAINNTVNPFAAIGGANKPLYNGNISAMSVNVPKVGDPMLYQYSYDVLNRLKGMNAEHGLNAASNTWTPISVDDFKERVTYDPNGNILTYHRNGNNTWEGKPSAMDKLTYHYNAGTNKLNWVHDSVPAGNYDVDIDEQEADNYAYDAIGNLISDSKDSLLSIEWTVYGKIKRITKANGTVIDYTYDASGNRLSKQVNDVETRYIRDATGNVMSIYVSGDAALNGGDLTQREVHLYGSSRLGIMDVALNVENPGLVPAYNLGNLGTGLGANFTRGKKFFELGNHLGNVMATVRDSKEAVSDGGSLVDYYVAKIVSAQDYYPFGMLMVGRSFDVGGYRYGFNGKENDDEVKGEGDQQDYGMRIYSPRIGRFLSVDPITKSYPELAPYQFASNRPIDGIDLDGLEFFKASDKYSTALYRIGTYKIDGEYVITDLIIRNLEIHNKAEKLYTPEAARMGSMDEAPEPISVKQRSSSKRAQRIQAAEQRTANNIAKGNAASTLVGLYKFIAGWVYNAQNGEDISYASSSAVALNQAIGLVSTARNNNMLPSGISNNPYMLTHLTNYLVDGTLPQTLDTDFNEMIKEWGGLIFDNRDKILGGGFDMKPITTSIVNVSKLDGINIPIPIKTGSTQNEVIKANESLKKVINKWKTAPPGEIKTAN